MSFAYPFCPVQFTSNGTLFQQSDLDALMAGTSSVSDLFIMCHGWNDDIPDATSLYEGLASHLKTQIDANPALSSRTYAIGGVLWPSKKFDDADLIPSGAAALNDAVTTEQLQQRVGDLSSLYAASEWPMANGPAPDEFTELASLMDGIENDPAAQTRAVELLHDLLPQTAASSEDASTLFFATSPEILRDKLTRALEPPAVPIDTPAASLDPFASEAVSGLGGAAGFRDVLGGIKSGILHLLNFSTYYLMKARAGDVGVKGLAPIIQKLRAARPELRLHLIGHSFGCRLVAAALHALPGEETFRPDTAMLLQGAFSHNGFALANDVKGVDRGAFRDVIELKKVRGPIVITCTRRDKAVGLAYPIASRIARVNASSIGDENDIFGGLGSNGTQTALTTPERIMATLLDVGQAYAFAGVTPSTPFNLKADQFISGHSDVQNPQVAFACTTAMAALPALLRATTTTS